MSKEKICLMQVGENEIEIQFQKRKQIFIFEEEEFYNLLKKYTNN